MPLLTLREPGFSTRVGVSKPAGASVAVCCAAATATLAPHNIRATDQYFPVMTMAAAPDTSIDQDHDRVDRGRRPNIPRNLLCLNFSEGPGSVARSGAVDGTLSLSLPPHQWRRSGANWRSSILANVASAASSHGSSGTSFRSTSCFPKPDRRDNG